MIKIASFAVLCSILILLGSLSEIETRPDGRRRGACQRPEPQTTEAGSRWVNKPACPYGRSYETPRHECCCARRHMGYLCLNKTTTTTEAPST